jgi:hypothetical protein
MPKLMSIISEEIVYADGSPVLIRDKLVALKCEDCGKIIAVFEKDWLLMKPLYCPFHEMKNGLTKTNWSRYHDLDLKGLGVK